MKNDMDIPAQKKMLEAWTKSHPKPTTGEFVSLLQQLGPPSFLNPDADASRLRCACDRNVSCDNACVVNTGHMTAVEPVCEPCRKDFEGQARIVCIRCRAVIGWLPPQKDKHGFVIEANHFYHVGECGFCKNGLLKADIIEMMLYYDDMGIPYDKDDILI